MKKHLFPVILILIAVICSCCRKSVQPAEIAATTRPVYEFTTDICRGTDLSVSLLVTDSVSCLHDYSLNVEQVRSAETARLIILSGAGLEDFMEDILAGKTYSDSSVGISFLVAEEHEDHEDHEEHHHELDPHIWLSPQNAEVMAQNICRALTEQYPQYKEIFEENLSVLIARLEELRVYGEDSLSQLKCREMITFHDGFAYFADSFNLTILEAIEEESGSEASAQELVRLIQLTQEHHLPAVFAEKNGSPSAASVISAETGAKTYTLDMAMSDGTYFDAMYHNIDTIKEALG